MNILFSPSCYKLCYQKDAFDKLTKCDLNLNFD